MSTFDILLFYRSLTKLSLFASWPAVELWLTLSGSNYSCLEQTSMVPKVFEQLKLNCIINLWTQISLIRCVCFFCWQTYHGYLSAETFVRNYVCGFIASDMRWGWRYQEIFSYFFTKKHMLFLAKKTPYLEPSDYCGNRLLRQCF